MTSTKKDKKPSNEKNSSDVSLMRVAEFGVSKEFAGRLESIHDAGKLLGEAFYVITNSGRTIRNKGDFTRMLVMASTIVGKLGEGVAESTDEYQKLYMTPLEKNNMLEREINELEAFKKTSALEKKVADLKKELGVE